MAILIYGAGAVGGYLGGMLALAGEDVTLVVRPAVAEVINRDGLFITHSGITERAPVHVAASLDQACSRHSDFDLIILGMKAYDLEHAVGELAAELPAPSQIMTTQNGIGVEEIVAAVFGQSRTLAGSVTIPISRAGMNHLVVEREGRGLGLSPVEPGRRVDQWVALFRRAGLNVGARDDYRAMKWSKAFLNIMGNATSAILNRPPAEIYRLPDLFEVEMRMLHEALAVMKRLGIEVINLPGATARPLARALAFAPRFLLKTVFMQVIIHGRGDKMPSFHIDLANGKKQSEVAFHNGAIAEAGRGAGVPVPVNAALYATLMDLCRDSTRRAWFDSRPDRLLEIINKYNTGGIGA